MNGRRHKRAFDRWRERLPKRTKLLVDAVVEILVPEIQIRGFLWVDDLVSLGGSFIDRADTIPLQRKGPNYHDVVAIDFSKNRQPNFGVSFRRWTDSELANREMWLPHFLAKRSSMRAGAKRFGFSSLDPFVTAERCKRLVQSVVSLLGQMDGCFESGEIGPNVTKDQFISVRKA